MSKPKVRPCKRGCGYPALKGRQFCYWHALMRMSSDEQAAEANRRLMAWVARCGDLRRTRVPQSDWPEGERWCAGCQSFVPKFYTSGSRCKACVSAAAHAARLEKTYGIDAAEYERIFAKQGRRCAICGNRSRTIRFAVDHDHKTGAVRGILCKRCNHDLLGGGHDSIDVLFKALRYLLYPPAVDHGFTPTDAHVLTALRDHLEARRDLERARVQDDEPPPF